MRIHFQQGDVIAAQHATGWTAFFEDKDIIGEGETMMDAIADLNDQPTAADIREDAHYDDEDAFSRREYDLQRALEYRRES